MDSIPHHEACVFSDNGGIKIHRYHESSFSASTPSRKLYRSVVNSTAKKGYRSDLRAEAVARASTVKLSQKEKKDLSKGKVQKSRSAKARKARAEEASA